MKNLQEWWLKLKEWWANLASREKQAVMIGGSVLGVFILYAGVWSPYVEHIALMRNRIVTEQKMLIWMKMADKEISKMQGQSTEQTKVLTPVVLLSALQKQVDHDGLTQNMTQLKQANNDSVEMHFQKVDFDKLIGLLTTTVKEQRVSIPQFSVVAEATPGIVNADLALKIE